MRETEFQILTFLRKDPKNEFSTTQIVWAVEGKDAEAARKLITSDEKKQKVHGKSKLAQLHRKILYHLNRLVTEKLLVISRIGEKGEKYFSLALGEGEELHIEKNHRRIIITRPVTPALPIEGYEQKGIIQKFEEKSWVEKLNSVLVNAESFTDLTNLANFLVKSFDGVNDVIGLYGFERVLKMHNDSAVSSFMHNLAVSCEDYGRSICFIIDLEKADRVESTLPLLTKPATDLFSFVFEVHPREVNKMGRIVAEFTKARIPLNIKNKDQTSAPFFVGRAGIYNFSEEDWRIAQTHKSQAIACAQSTLCLDVYKYVGAGKDFSDFRKLLVNASKALLVANQLQRKGYHDYFGSIWKTASTPDFMLFSRNYIRFWNFEASELPLELVRSAKEEIDRFSASEYIIYQACGMPTRFEIALAPAFKMGSFSPEQFQRMEITRPEELLSEKTKNILRQREELSSLFNGGGIASFYNSGALSLQEFMRVLETVATTYRFPLINFEFKRGSMPELKLTEFM